MQSKISKYSVEYFNQAEFHSLKREIFTNDSYYFETKSPSPTIIDVGAYIGLSVLYFKKLYPSSKILGFEPYPRSVEILKRNIFNNSIKNVEIHESAIWIKNGARDLYVDNTGMERFSVASFDKDSWNRSVKSNRVRVKTERLNQYLDREINLLKLDVEGTEQQILKNIKGYLDNVENIILEYHPTENQNLDQILKILQKKYDIKIFEEGKDVTKKAPNDRLLTIKAIDKH
jgi:FkbM family methyltransferase